MRVRRTQSRLVGAQVVETQKEQGREPLGGAETVLDSLGLGTLTPGPDEIWPQCLVGIEPRTHWVLTHT